MENRAEPHTSSKVTKPIGIVLAIVVAIVAIGAFMFLRADPPQRTSTGQDAPLIDASGKAPPGANSP